MNSKLFHTGVSVIIIVISFMLYYPTVKYDMVWDDEELLLNEPIASGRQHWSLAFTSPVDRLYRPLRTISYFFTKEYMKVPWGHHAINVFLFSCTALCAYWFLVLFNGGRIFPAVAAMLYTMHPVHAEVVPWITGGRANLMAGPMIFSSLALYITARNIHIPRKRIGLMAVSMISFLGAVLSKESALIVPLIIAAVELTHPFDKNSSYGNRFRRMIFASVPYLFLGIGFFIIRTHVLRGASQVFQYHGGSLYATAASMLPVLADYVRIILYPLNLCAVYSPRILHTIFEVRPMISLVFLVILLLSGFAALRRAPLISFAIFWFFICILPVSNIIPIAAMQTNRFLSEACLAGCISVAYLVTLLFSFRKATVVSKTAAALIFLFAANLYLTNTIKFRNVFKDNYSLWTSAVKCAPNSEAAFNNLGFICYYRGMIPEATAAFERARDLNPGFVNIRRNLGDLYAMQGRYDDALVEFRTVYFYNPSPDTVLKIGLLYSKMGNRQMAVYWLEQALSRDEIPEEQKDRIREQMRLLRREKADKQ